MEGVRTVQTQRLGSVKASTRARGNPHLGGLRAAVVLGPLVVLGGLVLHPVELQSGARPGATTEPSVAASVSASFALSSPDAGRTAVPAVTQLLALDVPAAPKADPRVLYGASADGRWWASRDSVGGAGKLHLHRSDGASVDLELGPVEEIAPQVAAFSPDSKRLAVADGAGALWVVDLATVRASIVARSGPLDLVFGESLAFAEDGRLYVQLVGSIDVPIPARVGVVDLVTGAMTIISEDTWAYGPRPLANGGVAYAHLNEDGSFTVRQDVAGKISKVADVGFLHGGLDISADGRAVWSDGSITWIVDKAGDRARRLGDGARPRFSPDGRSVVLFRPAGERSVLLGLDGTLLAEVASPFVRLAVNAKEP
jgi:hypothetical protein